MDRNSNNPRVYYDFVTVALHRSAWIEIVMYGNNSENAFVALHRSAWIEIIITAFVVVSGFKSHSTGVRG